jgi:hypothetical protein
MWVRMAGGAATVDALVDQSRGAPLLSSGDAEDTKAEVMPRTHDHIVM